MARRKKPKLGRPPLGEHARTNVLTLKVSDVERTRWQSAADRCDLSLSEFLRDRIEHSTIARIEIERDEDAWHWVAYDGKGRPASMAGISDGPEIEARVIAAAIEHGLSVDDGVSVTWTR